MNVLLTSIILGLGQDVDQETRGSALRALQLSIQYDYLKSIMAQPENAQIIFNNIIEILKSQDSEENKTTALMCLCDISRKHYHTLEPNFE